MKLRTTDFLKTIVKTNKRKTMMKLSQQMKIFPKIMTKMVDAFNAIQENCEDFFF